MTLAFTPPPEEAKDLPRYASYVVGSGMKLHGRVGDAKNSLSNRGWHYVGGNPEGATYSERRGNYVTKRSFILENVNGKWYTLYDIAAGLTKDELPWMKEYFNYGWGWTLYTDYLRTSTYYQNKLANGEARIRKQATAMTRDEYVAWRIKVELESRGITE